MKLRLIGLPAERPVGIKALMIVAWSVLVGVTAATVFVFALYYKYSEGLPVIPDVHRYWPPIVSEVLTDDSVLAGEFYNERRKVVPYERIPKRLVQAFIASEDSSFFDHAGVDVLGTARAAFKTLLKKASGSGSVQGGSTLTQQTAKAILISAEGYETATKKNLKRKIREAILARRLETQLTKEEILYLYLNNVYLGHHAYGVQAAAENYYRKDGRDLSLGEMTLIAGLPQAPSKYSPFTRPDEARRRRSYVLRRMKIEGMISEAERQAADFEEIKVFPVEDIFHEFAPYFVEQIRKDVVQRYGNALLLNQGLRVFATMDSEKQRAAQKAMLEGLLALDKRQGYRGPLLQLTSASEQKSFISRVRKILGSEKVTPGHLYLGLITGVAADGTSATVEVGSQQGLLPLLGMRWARKVDPTAYYPGQLLNSVKSAVHLGDAVLVRAVAKKDLTDDHEQYNPKMAKEVPEDGTLLFRLEQEPELQGALVSIDPHRQALVAMVGGYDFDANEFNRAFQACRQPGSSYKPLVYSAALEKLHWTEATVIIDSPIVFDDPNSQLRWKPENYSEGFVGDVLLRNALINSMNIPAVKTFQAVGVRAMSDWAKKLGLSTPMNQDFSAALGSSCVYPYELATVYATFNRLGQKLPTYFVRKIEDRFGRTLEDHTYYDDAWAPLRDRMGAGYAHLFQTGEQVMSRETGFLIRDLMRGVVREGTGTPALKLGKPAAGKTGTTNDAFDAWFAGFTQDLVSVAWVGYDTNIHPLGRYETGGRAALPIWLSYMKQALSGKPQPEFEPPADLKLVTARVDPKTGKRASKGGKGLEMWFIAGTAPQEQEAEKGQVRQEDFMMMP